MSLVPLMFRDWWDDMDISRPSRLIDQHFGIGLNRDDLLSSMSLTPSLGSSLLRTRPYYRPWRSLSRQDSGSTVTCDKDKFEVILDVQQFNPSEITVKTNDQNTIIVEGKHEEKKDEHGFISRHFIRKYMVPTGHDVKDVISSLSSDGILTITAPKKALPASGERIVSIIQTGPARQTPEQPIIEHVN